MNGKQPEIGELVKRLDDGRIGRVLDVATSEHRYWRSPIPPHIGDVVVSTGHGCSSTITSGGDYFWTKWERIDVAAIAADVLAMSAVTL